MQTNKETNSTMPLTGRNPYGSVNLYENSPYGCVSVY